MSIALNPASDHSQVLDLDWTLVTSLVGLGYQSIDHCRTSKMAKNSWQTELDCHGNVKLPQQDVISS